MSLISLPGDVHVHLLHALPNLYTLQSAILTHSSLYSTYITYRTQILKSIFLNQLYAPEDDTAAHKDKPNTSRRGSVEVVDILIPDGPWVAIDHHAKRRPRSIFERAFGMIPKSIKDTQAWENRQNQLSNQFSGLPKATFNHPDSEIFLSAVWFIMPDKPTGSVGGSVQALRWAGHLTNNLFYNDKPLEALKIASQIWDSISKSRASFKLLGAIRIPGVVHPTARERNRLELQCINFLIAIYRVLQMNEDAIDFQKDILNRVNPRSWKDLHSSYSLGLSQTYKSLGPSYLPTLIAFQTETWELYSQVYTPSHAVTRDWSRHRRST